MDKGSKKKTEKKLAAREEAKLLAGFMGVMNNMRKQVPPLWEGRTARGGGGVRGLGPARTTLFFLCPCPPFFFFPPHAPNLQLVEGGVKQLSSKSASLSAKV